MPNEELFEMLQASTIMGSRMVASKVQEAILAGTDPVLSEDDNRIIAEVEAANAPPETPPEQPPA